MIRVVFVTARYVTDGEVLSVELLLSRSGKRYAALSLTGPAGVIWEHVVLTEADLTVPEFLAARYNGMAPAVAEVQAAVSAYNAAK